ncbi:hypothetical protein ACIQ7Q_00830 [Streptomyces sp. NPDC096176]|uniref:hypothetical protein n=1 Tax=Streptomyces sp. NPDC096176 TaxID=3366079 RepID=UPI0037F706C6
MRIDQLAEAAGLSAPRRYAVDWERAERELGTRLPADYKEYVYWFGPGCFDDYLFVAVPGIENANVELGGLLRNEQVLIASLSELSGTPVLLPVHPEPSGWLPWGRTSNGDVLYWVVSSEDPDQWKIAGRPGRGLDLGHFDAGFADFIHAFVWDTVDLHFIAETDSEVPITFEPTPGEWRGSGEQLQPYGRFESE